VARLSWSLVALDNLEDITVHLAEDSPAYAAAFTQRVFEASDRLKEFPELGRIVPEYDRRDLRELIFQGYRILYRIDGDDVRIVVIVHGSRDLKRLLPAEPWNLI
jgi:plasmid stabilization system protein ParE